MTSLFNRDNILTIIIMLLGLLFTGSLYASPQEISGIVNDYGRVNTIEAADAVILDDVSGFSAGDTVLFIQMKGVSVYTTQSSSFGSTDGYLGQPDHKMGFYEFIIIEQVEPGPNRITFRSNLIGYPGYDVEGFIQLVRVPSYENAAVKNPGLTCEPWDSISGTGGVLAVIVNSKLVLDNGDIDVTGKGFKGGAVSVMDGAPLGTDIYYYDESSTVAGRKGEGMASHTNLTVDKLIIPPYAKGRAPLHIGGGGATGAFSGAGGGGSFGQGGKGGNQDGAFVSGSGGINVDAPSFSDRVIMGGGGGGSGYRDAGTGSGGAAGGGMVFVLADVLVGNGNSVIANGDTVTTVASGEGGAGGGGGAGSIVLSVKTFVDSCSVKLEAKGGTGGHSTELYGAGGGGGGGLVWISSSGVPDSVLTDVSGGSEGQLNWDTGSGSNANPGADGIVRTDLKMLLNGFLFNSLISSYTGETVDSICYGQVPFEISGTEPVGGTEPYTFRWERKGDEESSWSLVAGSGSTRDLVPIASETDTVQFRRVVTDDSTIPISDTSKPVTFIVQPLITDNMVGYDTIICESQDPELLVPDGPGPGGGNNVYTYTWIDSTDVQTWQMAAGDNKNNDYDPPVLNTTTFYSRIIESGRCIDTSNITKVTVLPSITNNTITGDQLICADELFADLEGSDPLDGDGTYRYEWISSPDLSIWVPAEGTSNTKNYNPDEGSPNFPGDQYYRRIVKSGLLDCCVDSSSQLLLTSLPVIGDNNISSDQSICENEIPAQLAGDPPVGGDGSNYTYIWEDSTRTGSWSLIAGADQQNYQPDALVDTTWYRRIIISSACDDTSNVIVVNVTPAILNNSISTIEGDVDTTICSGQVPNALKGEAPAGGDGIYIYEWQSSADQVSWSAAAGINDQVDYSPEALTQDTWFRRKLSSGECETFSNSVKITVLPLITNNTISSDQVVCFNTQPALLDGSDPLGGNGTYTYIWQESDDNVSWSTAGGSNTNADYQPPVLTTPKYYRRIVKTGLSDCCVDTSNVISIGIHDLPTGNITYALDTLCKGSSVAVDMTLTGAAPWSIVLNDGTADLPAFSASSSTYTFNHSPEYSSDYTFATIADANGCVATLMTGNREAVVYEVPVADAGSDDEVCGDIYTLEANPSVGAGQWLNFTGAVATAADNTSPTNEVRVNSYGTHTFWWKETNWQCVDSAGVDITFWEEPSPAIAGNDTVLAPYDYEFVLQAQEPLVGAGEWTVINSPNDLEFDPGADIAGATISNLADGENVLRWTVSNGEICALNEDELKITVKTIMIPNGFAPNSTFARNQVFYIEGIENTDNTLMITNRAGVVVYRSSGQSYQNDWQGLSDDGKVLPEGTYYYYLSITSPVKVQLSGFVVIKR
ncbi:MAG: gliding motility-associated C-terminal domain-containing protein [Bacteroidales bacterium]|nr:gliding motility-associated C-terminal domain-containing protein [Bacteroidales bacterium]